MENKTPFADDPYEYILDSEEDGTRTAVNPIYSLSILPDEETKLFKRRFIRGVGSDNPEYITALVGELDGVRIYVIDNNIIMTKQDLYL